MAVEMVGWSTAFYFFCFAQAESSTSSIASGSKESASVSQTVQPETSSASEGLDSDVTAQAEQVREITPSTIWSHVLHTNKLPDTISKRRQLSHHSCFVPTHPRGFIAHAFITHSSQAKHGGCYVFCAGLLAVFHYVTVFSAVFPSQD